MGGDLLMNGIGFNVLDQTVFTGEIPGKTLPEWIGIFAIGMLAALALERRNTSLTRSSTATCMLLGFAIVILRAVWTESPVLPDPVLRGALLAPLSAVGFALVIAAAAEGGGRSIAWLRSRPLAYAGTHQPAPDVHTYWALAIRVWPEAREQVAHGDFHGAWIDWLA